MGRHWGLKRGVSFNGHHETLVIVSQQVTIAIFEEGRVQKTVFMVLDYVLVFFFFVSEVFLVKVLFSLLDPLNFFGIFNSEAEIF